MTITGHQTRDVKQQQQQQQHKNDPLNEQTSPPNYGSNSNKRSQIKYVHMLDLEQVWLGNVNEYE